MELVDPNISSGCNGEQMEGSQERRPEGAGSGGGGGGGPGPNPNRDGWGTAEATEMITNNLFYITVKVREGE